MSYSHLSEGETGHNVARDSAPLPKDGHYINVGSGVSRSVVGALFATDLANKVAEFSGGFIEVLYDEESSPQRSHIPR